MAHVVWVHMQFLKYVDQFIFNFLKISYLNMLIDLG
jgi:hypothetical protein